MKPHDVFRYAVLAAAHLVSSLSEADVRRVRAVLLFGSTARLAASERSDIDLFFDVSAPQRVQRALRAGLNKAADQFYLTSVALAFKSRGIDNELSIKVGNLPEWQALAQGMSSHAIVLYGSYTRKPPGLKAYTILSWEAPGKAKGALLNKLYGYKARKKRYPGLLEKHKGMKLGRAVIMVPARSRDEFVRALEKYHVSYSRHDVWGS